MGAYVKYLHTDPKSGRLIYRRAFPPELLPFIPGNRKELKVSLKSKNYDPSASVRFAQAGNDYDRITTLARRQAERAYDALDEARIEFLAKTFLRDHLELDEASRWQTTAPTWSYPSRRDYEADYDECRALLAAYDRDGLVAYWRQWACEYGAAQGYVLDPTSTSFSQLCRALGEASCELWLALDKRIDGKEASTPPRPSRPTVGECLGAKAAGCNTRGDSFEVIAERLLTNERLAIGPATRQASRTALRFLREAHGELAPSAISRAVVSEWLDLLSQRPTNLKGPSRRLELRDVVKKFEGMSVPRMSNKTIAQHVGMLAALWNKAQDEGDIGEEMANPFKRRGLKATSKPREHVELSINELAAIFALPVFTQGARPKAGQGEACYWLPLLLLHTGARPEEMAQLIADDLFVDAATGRLKLKITDEGSHPIKGERSLKTSKKQSGRRIIPVPQSLVDLGFASFVDSVRKAGGQALFPALSIKGERGLLFENFGRWWSKYLREQGVILEGDRRRPAREFRHVWTTAARASGVPREAMEYIQGHKAIGGSAHEVYGSKEPLGRYIDDVRFDGLDLAGVQPWKPKGGGK